MTLTTETRKRKADHIRISLRRDVQARTITTGLDDVHFIHRALPEINKHDIDLSVSVFDHEFAAPLMAGAITGGTSKARKINATIAQAVEKLDLGMGVGSERAALEDHRLESTFSAARQNAPTAFLMANIGGVQFVNGYGLKEIRKAIDIVQADAIAVHLNPLQEAVQPEGQTNFKGIANEIKQVSKETDKPLIIKETGAGISAEDAKKLANAGVRGIDVSGAGGTSFAAVEYYRISAQGNTISRRLSKEFWDWGIPTAVSVVEVSKSVTIPIIASGGIRNGIDVAKAIALGASIASLSRPVLEAADIGVKETIDVFSLLMEELKNTMFLVGAKSIHDLAKVPLVITGSTAEWLKRRGFDVDEYAKRGYDRI